MRQSIRLKSLIDVFCRGAIGQLLTGYEEVHSGNSYFRLD